MTTSMKSKLLSVTAGLAVLVFLPEAKARGPMGMPMFRPSTMGANMMNGRVNLNMGQVTGAQPRFNPGVQRGFMPNAAFTPNSRFTPPGSNGGVFNQRRFDRFEDEFERRFGRGSFDRFEDLFENRFRFGRDRFEDEFERRFGRGSFGRFEDLNRWWWPGGGRWWWWPSGGLWLGSGGLDGLGSNWFAPADGSQNSVPTSTRRSRQVQSTPTETPEQERERIHQQELAWSRSELPDNETTSAIALNVLLADLQGLQARGIRGPEVQIDPSLLLSLNVAVTGRSGNIGVLKGQINWPVALSGTDFEVERSQIDSLISKAIDQATNGETVDLRDLTGALASMRSRLAAKVQEIPGREYIPAKRLLDQLEDAVRLLRRPDAGLYFNRTYAAKGQTVAQLVQYMTQHGLQFAPAVEGNEPAYAALHQALAKYDLAANSQVAAMQSGSARK